VPGPQRREEIDTEIVNKPDRPGPGARGAERGAIVVVIGLGLVAITGCDIQFHPEGWSAPAQHGLASNLQGSDCRLCHGEDFGGGSSQVSCDNCHETGWEKDCTFCHGQPGFDGAPPRDLAGIHDPSSAVARVHDDHPSDSSIARVQCGDCHVVPKDAAASGHLSDLTPGRAEVSFSGVNAAGVYQADGTCAENYCHGDGRRPASLHIAAAAQTECGDCHAFARDGARSWGTLSGAHARHLTQDVACQDCHSTVVAAGRLIGRELHINGEANVAMPARLGIALASDSSCSGTCHDHDHTDATWGGGGAGSHHPPEWYLDNDVHGRALKMGTEPCANGDCHGADLGGGDSGVSCDGCHEEGWRTSCTFCHADNGSLGLPTRFVDHTEHVLGRQTHTPMDCGTCHPKPSALLTPGHFLDATPGKTELRFTGLAQGTRFNAGTCADSYCHGNGRSDGQIRAGTETNCNTCHPRNRLADEHDEHLDEGVTCDDCHGGVASSRTAIRNPALHVNGRKDVALPSAVTRNGDRCSGRCHGEGHSNERW
jgi:hypothetical protein